MVGHIKKDAGLCGFPSRSRLRDQLSREWLSGLLTRSNGHLLPPASGPLTRGGGALLVVACMVARRCVEGV